MSEIPRTPGLCASVILDDVAYVVRNARTDARTLANPLVAGEMGLQFYAAAPLVTHDGHRLGTFCIIDFEPREFDTEGEETLRSLAGMVMDQMELRLNSRKAVASVSQLVASAIHTVESKYYVTVCAWSKQIKVGHEWMTFEQFLTSTLGVSVTHAIHPDVAHELQKQTQMP